MFALINSFTSCLKIYIRNFILTKDNIYKENQRKFRGIVIHKTMSNRTLILISATNSDRKNKMKMN